MPGNQQDIDSIGLQISADASNAEQSLDKLCASLNRLKSSLENVGKYSNQLTKLSTAMSSLSIINTAKLASVSKSLSALGSINVKASGISLLTNSLQRLIKESANFDSSKIDSIGKSLQGITSLGQSSDSMNGFIKSINSFARSGQKMKETANAFPALALEMQEFFDSMQNVTIADNTVRMAEALAQIAKSGKNASAAMQNVSGSAAQTGKQFNYASVVGRGLNKVLDSIISALKKIGGGALNGIKALATNLSNIGRSSSGVNSLTSNIKTLLGTMLGFRGIVGVFNWSKQMMKMGADVTEIDHIVKSVFGEDMVGYVNDWANDTMEKFGIASTAAKQYAGTMSAMFQASNVSVKDSNQMATDLVGLAGDLSAFYNIDTETAYNKIKSGMAGMVRPLRDLGIDLSVATLKEYALAQGIDKSWTSMTQAEKVMLRYRYLMDATKQQQNDFARTSLSLANSFRTLRAYTAEITRQIGVGLGAAIRHAVVGLNILMKYVLKAATVFADFMQKIFGKYEGGASGLALDMEGISDDTDAFADSADNAGSGLDDAAKSAKQLKKDLSVLPFDELNQLNKDKESETDNGGSGSGGGGGLDGIGDVSGYGDGLFSDALKKTEGELTAFEKFLKQWKDKCAKSLAAKDWEQLGKDIAWGLNKGIDVLYKALDPDKWAKRLNPWLDAFSTTVNSLVDNLHWEKMGRTVGRGVNVIVNALNRLIDPKTGIDFKNLGKKLAEGANGLVDEINWTNLGQLFGNKFMIVWRMAQGFAHRFNWKGLGTALGKGINGLNDAISWEDVADAMATSLNGLFATLESFAKTVKWGEIAQNIADGMNKFIHDFEWKKNGRSLNTFIQNLLDALLDVVAKTDWYSLGKGIGDFLSEVDWTSALTKAADAFVSAFSGLLEGFGDTVAGRFLTAFGTALVVGKVLVHINSFTAAFATALSGTQQVGVVAAGFNSLMSAAGSSGILAGLASISTVALPVAASIGLLLIGAIWGQTTEGKQWNAESRQALQTDIEGGLKEVENSFYGHGYSVQQLEKDKADKIIAENERWKQQLIYNVIPEYVRANGEAEGSVARLQTAVSTNNTEIIAKLEEWARLNTGYTGQIVQSNTTVLGAYNDIKNKMFEVGASVQQYGTAVQTAQPGILSGYQAILTKVQEVGTAHQQALGEEGAKKAVNDFETAVVTGATNMGSSWKQLKVDENGHKQSLLESMQQQTTAIQNWERDLTTLSQKGVDQGFLNEIAKMGTEGLPLIQEALKTVEEEGGVSTLNETWKNLIDAQGMMDDVGQTLKESGVSNISSAFKDITVELEGDGVNIVSTVAKSMEDNNVLLTDAGKKSAQALFNAFEEESKIGSPSKVAEEDGGFIIEGLKNGIEDNASELENAMSTLAENMMTSFTNTIDISGMIDSAFSEIYSITSTVYGYGEQIGQALADGIGSISIPTPYINVSSWDWIDLGDGAGFSVPNFNVNWYAKGGLFTNAAVFGEAGDEAALPLENQRVMKRIAGAIIEGSDGGFGMTEEAMASAVTRGFVQAMMANQNNMDSNRPINIVVKTESDEVLARAVFRGMESIDYRNNATPKYSY